MLQWPCRVETMPASFWFKVVMFLAFYDDASAIHATSKAVRDHTAGEWQRIELPRRTYAWRLRTSSKAVWQRNLSGSKLAVFNVTCAATMRTATKVKIVSRRYKARAQNPAFWIEKCFIRIQKSWLARAFAVRCSGWAGCRPRATHVCTKPFRVDIKRRDEVLGGADRRIEPRTYKRGKRGNSR